MKQIEDEVVYLNDLIDRNKPKPERYDVGFSSMKTAMKGGMKAGDLIIIGGPSGHGKSTLAMTITYNLCKQGLNCLWFTYELTEEEVDEQFLSMGISSFYDVVVPKQLTTGNLGWVKKKIIEANKKYGTVFVFIDHLDDLVPIQEGSTYDRHDLKVKATVSQLKSMARELKIVIVLMAHIVKRTDGKPLRQEDFAGSGGIYQLSDYSLMIQREEANKSQEFGVVSENTEEYTSRSIIKFVKNRQTGIFAKVICEKVNNRLVDLQLK